MMPLGSKQAPPQGSEVRARNKEDQLQSSSSLKLEDVDYLVCIFLGISTKFVHMMLLDENLPCPGGLKLEHHKNKEDQLRNYSCLKPEDAEL